MSVEAVAWALRVPVGGNAKVVLLGIANHAHHDGTEAYPSLQTLADYACCDRSTAKRHVAKLAEAGWIIKDGVGPVGQSKWRLPIGGVQSASPQGVAAVYPSPVAAVPPEPSIEPSPTKTERARESGIVGARVVGTTADEGRALSSLEAVAHRKRARLDPGRAVASMRGRSLRGMAHDGPGPEPFGDGLERGVAEVASQRAAGCAFEPADEWPGEEAHDLGTLDRTGGP
jgi:hypothetical protein